MIPGVVAGGGSQAADVDFASVSLLLHQNGSGASFTDSSSNGHTVAAHGAVTQVSSPARFGAAAGAFDGNGATGSWLQVASHSSLIFGSGDFTIEGWFRMTTPAGGGTGGGDARHVLFATDATGLAEYSLQVTVEKLDDQYPPDFGVIKANVQYSDATSDSTTSGVVRQFLIDTWYYFGVTRSGNTFEVRIDGALHATWTSSKTIRDRGGDFIVGATGGGWEGIKGYEDEFRVTKGVARDITTVPSTPFPDS